MIITDKKKLEAFQASHRVWQGIPSIEISKGGRLFATFYSGGTKEYLGNYCILKTSDDGGNTWSDVVAVVYLGENYRAYDAALWRDPLGRLWWIWSRQPEHATFAYVCDDPDADELKFGERIEIGCDVQLNKPIVLETGEWLFPVAVWAPHIIIYFRSPNSHDSGAFVYKTIDQGKTFTRLGGADAPDRHFDEHMIYERKDGSLVMLIRTHYGIAQSVSYNGGLDWTKPTDSGLGGPDSRFHVRRLKSGRLLLVNHKNFVGRNNITAMLSDDDGQTWSEGLLLDERDRIAYPDVAEGADGTLYVIYDHDRGGFEKSYEDAAVCAREILLARITEEDILARRLVSPNSALKLVVDKLGAYDGDPSVLYESYAGGESSYVCELATGYSEDEVLARVMADYGNCITKFTEQSRKQIDDACTVLAESHDICERVVAVGNLIAVFRSGEFDKDEETFGVKFLARMRSYVYGHLADSRLSLDTIASDLKISKFYMCHFFKRLTGTTLLQYINYCRLNKAKCALVETDDKLLSVAIATGFVDASYFSKWFKRQEGVTPRQYRKLARIQK